MDRGTQHFMLRLPCQPLTSPHTRHPTPDIPVLLSEGLHKGSGRVADVLHLHRGPVLGLEVQVALEEVLHLLGGGLEVHGSLVQAAGVVDVACAGVCVVCVCVCMCACVCDGGRGKEGHVHSVEAEDFFCY